MKFTNAERARIKMWLEKYANTRDTGKFLTLTREDGTEVTLTRDTYYLPGGKWKLRIAYEITTTYPVAVSSPLQYGVNKKRKQIKKPEWVMVPKLPLPERKDDEPGSVIPGNKVGNGVAFSKTVSAELEKLGAAYMAATNQPPIWGKATFDVYKKCATKGGHIVESNSDTSGDVGGSK